MADSDGPSVSVVVCTHDPSMLSHLYAAVESVLEQTYPAVDVVVVVDGAPAVAERARDRYGDASRVTVLENETNRGLSASRNRGVEAATGDVVAFMDDDAVADREWIAELVGGYRRHDALAVGGRMAPRWVAGKPDWLPPEFYWLVGVTHRGFPETEGEVRNTFGSNISFRRDVFVDLGGFDEALGLRGTGLVQGEETELCDRLRREHGSGVIYVPDAVVEHKVFERRLRLRWLLRRAYWQGVTKGAVQGDRDWSSGREERSYVRTTVIPGLLRTAKSTVTRPSLGSISRLVLFTALALATGAGYVRARVAGGLVWGSEP